MYPKRAGDRRETDYARVSRGKKSFRSEGNSLMWDMHSIKNLHQVSIFIICIH
jgi:hypothetical protein